MPSDKTIDGRAAESLAALSKAREAFRSALVATTEEVRSLLNDGGVTAEARSARTGAELGTFAVGHIDIERFAALQASDAPLPEDEAPRLEAAYRTLQALAQRGDDLHVVRTDVGTDLREAVATALARSGRAFGAARTVDLARSGRYDAEAHGGWLESFPPRLWNRRERELAPPLVVEVDGSDLQVAGLADFLDGGQKIVLVVRGDAPPAALARLVSPGVLVMQTDDTADLSSLAAVDGPAIVALVSSDACRFRHLPDPSGNPGAVVLSHLVEEEPKRAVGSISAFRQAEDLRLLKALASGWGPKGPEAAEVPSADGDATPGGGSPADHLAAWILRQADLSGPG